MIFGPDDNLYLIDGPANTIRRFNGTTRAYMRDFVAPGSGGLVRPSGLVFGPDENGDGMDDLYVTADDVTREGA